MRGSRGLWRLNASRIGIKPRHDPSHASDDEAIQKVPTAVDRIPNESPAPRLAFCRRRNRAAAAAITSQRI
jgi:hypothetical protein